jgi:O-acetyl-ADP-ribose deacetylase (regulator of RNase III)
MGGGIAKLIADKYPVAKDADLQTKAGDKSKLGKFSTAYDKTDNLYIYNLYSQYTFGTNQRQTSYDAFYIGMSEIKSHMKTMNLSSAAIPYGIGCGLGGASWKIINAMLQDLFDETGFTLYICEHNPKNNKK